MKEIYYRELQREYDEKLLYSQRRQHESKQEIYKQIPRIKELDDEISSLSVERAISAIGEVNPDLSEYKAKIALLKKEKDSLLLKNGYQTDAMEIKYSCSLCKDTGFVNGVRCQCFTQALINKLYSDSHLQNALKKENFSTFNYDFYSDESPDADTDSPLQNIKKVVKSCIGFINNFDNSNENLLIYGRSGVGKTFLTNCIANELINSLHSVVYISAIAMFEAFSSNITRKYSDEDKTTSLAVKNFFDADLLIIDDLGTELTNSLTNSQLFNCINERLLQGKATIISTNLSVQDIRETYSERLFSRILSNYNLLKIYGEDIRILKKRLSNQTSELPNKNGGPTNGK